MAQRFYQKPEEATIALEDITRRYENYFKIKLKGRKHKKVLDFLEKIDIDIKAQTVLLKQLINSLPRGGIILLDTSIIKPLLLLSSKESGYTLTDILYSTEVSGLKGMTDANKTLLEAVSEYSRLIYETLMLGHVTTTQGVLDEIRCGYELMHYKQLREEKGLSEKRRTTKTLAKKENDIYFALLDKKFNNRLVLAVNTRSAAVVLRDLNRGYMVKFIGNKQKNIKLEAVSEKDIELILAAFHLADRGTRAYIISNDLALVSNARKLATAYKMERVYAYDVRGCVGDIEKDKFRGNDKPRVHLQA